MRARFLTHSCMCVFVCVCVCVCVCMCVSLSLCVHVHVCAWGARRCRLQVDEGQRLVLVWHMTVRADAWWYDAHVDAHTGAVHSLVDWVADASYLVRPAHAPRLALPRVHVTLMHADAYLYVCFFLSLSLSHSLSLTNTLRRSLSRSLVAPFSLSHSVCVCVSVGMHRRCRWA
jgi:hypothetical protein